MRDKKKNTSLVILLFISFIFAVKYINKATDYALLISVFIILLQFLIYKYETKILKSTKWISVFCYSTILLLFIVVILTRFKIPVETLNIDRYSVITSFIDEALKGNYPYYAQSVHGNYPGPMPFYFLIAFPFYLIGELCLLSFFGFGLFIFLVSKKTEEYGHIKFFLFYILTSFYVYWEIATRSNIFTISVLIMLSMNYYINLNKESKLKLYLFALIAGLLLSTRSVYIIVYIVFFFSDILNKKLNFKQLLIIGCFVFIGFSLTFLPILIFFRTEFFIMNPFTIQSSFIVPQIYVLAFLLVTTLLTFTVKTNSDKFFISGLSLFISIFIYACYAVFDNGLHAAIFGNSIDISYFIFCVPFLLYFLLIDKPTVNKKLT